MYQSKLHNKSPKLSREFLHWQKTQLQHLAHQNTGQMQIPNRDHQPLNEHPNLGLGSNIDAETSSAAGRCTCGTWYSFKQLYGSGSYLSVSDEFPPYSNRPVQYASVLEKATSFILILVSYIYNKIKQENMPLITAFGSEGGSVILRF